MPPRLPRSVVDARRDEVTNLQLPLLDGTLPDGLGGHFFVVAPVSTVAWGGRPHAGQPSLLNGDGMICRFDLGGGGVVARSRLARTLDFEVDQLTHEVPALSLFGFLDAGIA